MRNRLLLFVSAFLFAGMIIPASLNAGEISVSTGKSAVTITANSYQQLSFKSDVSSVQFRSVATSLGNFTELFIEGYGYSNTVGSPKLPVYHKLIEVPLNATFTVAITRQEFIDYDAAELGITSPVIPAQAPVSKAILDASDIPFVKNSSVYLQNELLGGPVVQVSPVGIMRAVSLARLDISPVQYNPATGKIRIYSTLEVTVVFSNGEEAATRAMKSRLSSPYFEKTYKLLGNYKHESDELITTSPVTYVIVSDPMFESALQPYIHWKTQKGFKVIQAYTNDPAVGNSLTSIKAYLQGLYETPPAGYNPPSFILFVGDVAQIPAWMSGGQATDLRYCEYTGDNLPEVYYGRFSATNVTQLQPQIDKTMEYERFEIPVPHFLDTCSMIAGADASHQLTWGNGQINYGTTYYFNTAHNLISHTYLQPEPPGGNYSQNIHQDVTDGVCYSNYTAHGSVDGWADPGFHISDIPNLQNLHKYPLMVGNCCVTSTYNQNSFGEELLRASGKGAVGYIGASNNSYWDEDYWWGCGFKAVTTNPVYDPNHLGGYDVTFHEQGEAIEDWYVTQGQMVVGGNMAVEESNSSMKTYYWEIYCLMGDPSLSIYFSMPPKVTATYASPVLVGTSSLAVTTEPYAYIGLSLYDTAFVAAACADATGAATLNFDPLTTPGYLGIVITKQNREPIIDSIQIIPATGAYLTMSSYVVNDSLTGNMDLNADFGESVALNVTVHNMGVLDANNVTATLTTTDTNITITDDSYHFETIPSGNSVTGYSAFGLTVKNNVSDMHLAQCTITFDDGTDTWTSQLVLPLHAPVLTIGSLTVQDPAPGGNNNGVLDPGETAVLRIATLNKGHAAVGNAISHLTVLPGSGAYIIANNPDYYIGNLPVSSMIFSYFTVITNGITPIGTVVNLNLYETAGMNNQYDTTKNISIEIGEMPEYLITNGSQTTCLGHFYDGGGPNGNYPDNDNKTMTFYPGTSGSVINVEFTAFDLEESGGCTYDYLKIYDGNGVVSPLMGTWCGTDSPGNLTASATGGALTFLFHSDYSDNFPGWKAVIKCVGGPLALIANAFPAQVCTGSTSQLTAIPTGGSGSYTYQWQPATYLDDPYSANPVCTPLADITYIVTVNDGTNSVTSEPIEVTVVPVPEPATITLNGTVLESSVADGNQWYLNGALITGANSQTYTPVQSGNYHVVIVSGTTGCFSQPSNVIPYYVTGFQSNDPAKSVTVFPNPFTDRMTVTGELPEAGLLRISLIDGFGKEVRLIAEYTKAPAGQFSQTVEAGNLNPGVYYCRIQTNTYTVVKKVLFTR